ncbi:MAG: hypothetical protein FWC50_04365, partial [Planctomycetaceae bacterium]|nr:hypothetical protein [Planctomycetaceae bacterium]
MMPFAPLIVIIGIRPSIVRYEPLPPPIVFGLYTQTVNGLCTKIIFEHVLARDSQIPGVFMPKMG